ncbi:unnamed protein product, partial [marine sediment metagenome]
ITYVSQLEKDSPNNAKTSLVVCTSNLLRLTWSV